MNLRLVRLRTTKWAKSFFLRLASVPGYFAAGSLALFFLSVYARNAQVFSIGGFTILSEKSFTVFGYTIDNFEKISFVAFSISSILTALIFWRSIEGAMTKLISAQNVLSKMALSDGDKEQHLEVTAPAGPWLQTSSWTEIVKKMRQMLYVHGWGQIPTLSDLRYFIRISDRHLDPRKADREFEPLKSTVNSSKILSVATFLRIDYAQWHGMTFSADSRHDFDLNLPTIIEKLIPVFVVMPFERYARDKAVLSNFTPIYPVTGTLEKSLSDALNLGDTGTAQSRVLPYLRKIDWMSRVDDDLLDDIYQDDKAFESVAEGGISDADKLGGDGWDKNKLGEPAFTIKVLFPNKRGIQLDTYRIRFASLFDENGDHRDYVAELIKKLFPAEEAEIDKNIVGAASGVVGCYVPFPDDLELLKEIGHQSKRAEDINRAIIFYNWAYLHIRSIVAPGKSPYTNDSWSFPLSNVAFLDEAKFRAGGNVSLDNEYAVIPYTMDFTPNTPYLKNGDVVFSGNYKSGSGTNSQLVTCPTDVFHISWDFQETATEVDETTEAPSDKTGEEVPGAEVAPEGQENTDEKVVQIATSKRSAE